MEIRASCGRFGAVVASNRALPGCVLLTRLCAAPPQPVASFVVCPFPCTALVPYPTSMLLVGDGCMFPFRQNQFCISRLFSAPECSLLAIRQWSVPGGLALLVFLMPVPRTNPSPLSRLVSATHNACKSSGRRLSSNPVFTPLQGSSECDRTTWIRQVQLWRGCRPNLSAVIGSHLRAHLTETCRRQGLSYQMATASGWETSADVLCSRASHFHLPSTSTALLSSR